jgi:hypothetical protein
VGSFTIDDSKPLRQLNPNQFYKICPTSSFDSSSISSYTSSSSSSLSSSLGRAPVCGDGSEFCFYFTRPPQRALNDERILIELMGGGACWDANTCDKQRDYLYINSDGLDGALGRSCQEVQYGMTSGGTAANMLCAATSGYAGNSGEGDGQQRQQSSMFAKYNTIIVPYCTQDVHVGAKTMTYEDGSMVHHMGAHNIASVLDWMYRNFRSPRHVAVTGCSAGATAVPVVQQLINQQYNHFGNRNTQVNALTDSPVYLTPTYFLENALGNWNPEPLMSKIGLPYNKYRTTEEYPTLLWDFILRKGDNRNRWGFVSHTSDPISLMYYEYMSNETDYNGDLKDQWYSELTESVSYIEKRHPNVRSFWMDSEGHCTFGWYYAIQEADFDTFASSIFKEDPLLTSTRPAVRAFLISFSLGVGLIGLLLFNKRRRPKLGGKESMPVGNDRLVENDEFSYMSASSKLHQNKVKQILVACEDYRVTVGYTVSVSVYFWAMICQQGFAHPVNNPSLGPAAVSLSNWGINNPSLVVYKKQWFRLLTTNFLFSGVLTYALALYYLWMRTRRLERRISYDFKSPWLFVAVAVLLATSINAIYCLVPTQQGASCTALPLLIGLQAFHLSHYWKTFTRPYLSLAALVFDTAVVSILFPFNSWIMLLSAMVIGPILGRSSRLLDKYLPANIKAKGTRKGITNEPTNPAPIGPSSPDATNASSFGVQDDEISLSYESMDGRREVLSDDHRRSRKKKMITRTVFCVLLAVFVVLLVPLFITLAASPNKVHMEPFYTGCKLYYTDAVDELYSSFSSSNDDQTDRGDGHRQLSIMGEVVFRIPFRWLGGRRRMEGDSQYECAEFCVPHILTPAFRGITRHRGIPIYSGMCQEYGYATKVLDKTLSALSYSLDVELYASNYENGDHNGH